MEDLLLSLSIFGLIRYSFKNFLLPTLFTDFIPSDVMY